MAALKPGDSVVVVERDPTAEDTKSGLYYSHFGNLAGTVDRVYDDGTVCVDVSIDALPDGIRRRHEATQNAAKARWLDSLSGEARARLTEVEKQFNLSYKILVSSKDVSSGKTGGASKSGARVKQAEVSEQPTPKPEPKATAAEPKVSPAKDARPKVSEAKVSRQAGPTPAKPETKAPKSAAAETEAHRLTQKDLDKAERAFLAQKAHVQAKPTGPRRTAGA